MARRSQSPKSSHIPYRNFAIAVFVIAVLVALFADGFTPHSVKQSPAAKREAPAPRETPVLQDRAVAAESVSVADSAEPDLADFDASSEGTGQEAGPAPAADSGLPKTGKAAPANQPTPGQIRQSIEASRARSGSGPDGD